MVWETYRQHFVGYMAAWNSIKLILSSEQNGYNTTSFCLVVIVKFIRTQFLVTVWLLALKELFHSAKWKHAECTTFFESQDWSYYCPVFLYQPVMPDEVNDRVNFLSHNQQELITFANHHSNPIGDHNPDILARTQQCHQ